MERGYDRVRGNVPTASPPNNLPVLTRGRHHRPEDGACLMEYVSVLSGEAFSDKPRCTHHALAELARVVNDSIDHDDMRTNTSPTRSRSVRQLRPRRHRASRRRYRQRVGTTPASRVEADKWPI